MAHVRVEIPFYSMKQEESEAFLIRPVQREVNAVLLQEEPHRHTYHEIIWIRSGSGQHTIDDALVHITPLTFYWIKQGQVHDFQKGTDLEGFLIRFTNAFLPYEPHTSLSTSLAGQFKSRTALPLEQEEVEPFERMLHALHHEYQRGHTDTSSTGILQHLLIAFLIMLERKSQALSASDIDTLEDFEKQVYRKFLDLLDQQYRHHHNVGYYASELGVSPRKLSSIVKENAGITAKKLILNCLMQEARRALAFTQNTLTEITYHLGFDDTAYFCRLFKNQTGKTPQQYKRELRLG